jgi:hypothetical protein
MEAWKKAWEMASSFTRCIVQECVSLVLLSQSHQRRLKSMTHNLLRWRGLCTLVQATRHFPPWTTSVLVHSNALKIFVMVLRNQGGGGS